MQAKLVSLSQGAGSFSGMSPQEIIMYCARVSNPANQDSGDTGLLRYCIKKGHWSIFEMTDMTVEFVTSRAISAQILRHKSFSFQEFSTRYAEVQNLEPIQLRRQDTKNRQNSIDDIPVNKQLYYQARIANLQRDTVDLYEEMLNDGIAKESARFVLPLNTQTRIYMKGSVRSWIHYFQQRLDESTQLEHRQLAQAVVPIFKQHFPQIAEALSL